jgi:hypothetical protein
MAKNIIISNLVDKTIHLNRVWEILQKSYKNVNGGLLFTSKEDLLCNSSEWKLIFYRKKVVGVMIFKAKFGRKIVAIGRDERYGQYSINALALSLEQTLYYAWMEVSEKAEEFILKYCNVYQLLIHQSIAIMLISKTIEPLEDGYHYFREIAGIKKAKILIGTPLMD